MIGVVYHRLATSARHQISRGILTCYFRSVISIFNVTKTEWAMQGKARINKQGRIVIPAECRAAAGLKPGDDLLIEPVGDGELRLRTRRQAIKEAQAIVARYLPPGRDLVQELIDERRDEAARE